MYGIPETGYSLEEYWQYLGISEPHGYGIRNAPDEFTSGCREYWQQTERYYAGSAIKLTEERLRKDMWLGFPVRRTYYGPRQFPWAWPLYAGKYLRSIGTHTTTLVDTINVDLSSDPVEFTVTVDFTDENELIIKYPTDYFDEPTTNYTIRPSYVSISGTTATVKIPKSRLLKPAYMIDYSSDATRPDYTDNTYFLDTVDVYRDYVNTTTGTTIVWERHKGHVFCTAGVQLIPCDGPSGPCDTVVQEACGYVRLERDGYFHVEPATYSSGDFVRQNWSVSRKPDHARVSYMRGLWDRYDEVDSALQRAIIAVVHNNMPRDYCACSVQVRYFEEDNKPLEPPVNLGLGPSTWGIYIATQTIREYDYDRESHSGGLFL